eukprot:CAMPEP_0114989452 /NCGR_PEP_ID=MMETSP0216-20121206/10207_1 /TAXON_ID=223996 /ORGANISM="Protocruzia adherens, Strain Boccale" /LENGTH=308 /DNA_ID=CAMNT_0002352435 /DNA_START=67 /DNA_END=993 /DNA_ORIENTATION=-
MTEVSDRYMKKIEPRRRSLAQQNWGHGREFDALSGYPRIQKRRSHQVRMSEIGSQILQHVTCDEDNSEIVDVHHSHHLSSSALNKSKQDNPFTRVRRNLEMSLASLTDSRHLPSLGSQSGKEAEKHSQVRRSFQLYSPEESHNSSTILPTLNAYHLSPGLKGKEAMMKNEKPPLRNTVGSPLMASGMRRKFVKMNSASCVNSQNSTMDKSLESFSLNHSQSTQLKRIPESSSSEGIQRRKSGLTAFAAQLSQASGKFVRGKREVLTFASQLSKAAERSVYDRREVIQLRSSKTAMVHKRKRVTFAEGV